MPERSLSERPAEVLVDDRDGVRWVTLNRPDKLNAFTWHVCDLLLDAFTVRMGYEAPRAIVLTGAGRGFCAGVDLDILGDEADAPEAERRANLERAQQVVTLMRTAPCPVVSAVNGVAAGGGWGLALGAGTVVATRSARFVTAFTQLGLVPDLGFAYNLTTRVGSMFAKSIILRGLRLDAAEALRLGAVDHVVPDDDLEGSVRAIVGAAA